MKYLRVIYSRKDCPTWKNTIELREHTVEQLKNEFGGIREYLNRIISGGVKIEDHYIIIK